MRFRSGLFQQHAVAKGGVQLDNDGEIHLRPTLLITLPGLGSPLFSLPSITPPTDGQTKIVSTDQSIAIATGASGFTIVGFDPGIWHIQIDALLGFSGTANSANSTRINLVAPDSTSVDLIRVAHLNIAGRHTEKRDLILDLAQEGGWSLNFTRSAIVAGDVSTAFVSVVAQKII